MTVGELTKGEKISLRKLRHGESRRRGHAGSPEWDAWQAMHQRCRPSPVAWHKNYSGRGITVDPRWNRYENFLEDMGRKPGPEFTLERKKNESGYSKENCRWATSQEQNSNKRSNHFLTLQGRTQTAASWADELGIPRATLFARLRRGWSSEEALEQTERGLRHG